MLRLPLHLLSIRSDASAVITSPSTQSPEGSALPETSDSESHVRFHAYDDAESFYGYVRGGYHPVAIGNRLGGHYKVLNKLGHGGYSTVWLARDERFQRLVAVKVCVADMSPRESEILSLLRDLPVANCDGANSVSGRGMIHTLLDTFHVIGPHGTHMCLVTEVTRCSVMQAKHNECHLWSDEELLEHCGEPELEKLQTFDDKPIPPGVPHIVTMPIWFPMERVNRLSLSDARIVLADFGEAHRSLQESKFVSCAPEYCRPPEARFEPTRPKSFSSDIWTLACSVWGTLARTPLFSMYWPTEDAVTSLQVEALGKLPDEWWEKWDARSKYFTEDGQPIRTNSDPLRTLCSRFSDAMQEGRLRHKETMGFDERKALFAMLQSMLLYRPEQRCTIKEVLGSEWMIKYAMPDYERMCTGASDTVGGWKGTSSRLALIRPEMIPTERRISPPAF
ncbi:SRSF protein kinase 1 [Beauveria bassiana]|uniref:non-specific serine/threonine protein kinase n=1 Tax=Beauveria bassiana TaxID=176275 RepID=A0A2N6NDL8_BEABA|nr:SRSF protein kinase 1 [Beauveria bassiana]